MRLKNYMGKLDINTFIDDSEYFNEEPYSRNNKKKEKEFLNILLQLREHHLENCLKYNKLNKNFDYKIPESLSSYPMLPVRLFKYDNVHSLPEEKIFKTLTSSGTSGQEPSKIYLDNFTARRQTKTLSKILSDVMPMARMPMIIIDFQDVRSSRNKFNARAAGVGGFSMFGKKPIYAFDENNQLNLEAIDQYIEDNAGLPIFLFGFTFVVWKHFISELKRLNKKIIFPEKSLLIHGGGWKKIEHESVSQSEFKNIFEEHTGIKKIVNYYGMVEQVGSIFTECSEGYYHTTNYNDILIRDESNFKPLEYGQTGLIQLFSILPTSYPGHSILTEDLGIAHGIDNCKCGKNGKYFSIVGRQAQSEPRGCSDVIK